MPEHTPDDRPLEAIRVTVPCPHCQKNIDFRLGKITGDPDSTIYIQNPALCPHCGEFLSQLPERAYTEPREATSG
jgi:phage terminase large subunit GpA-like protein